MQRSDQRIKPSKLYDDSFKQVFNANFLVYDMAPPTMLILFLRICNIFQCHAICNQVYELRGQLLKSTHVLNTLVLKLNKKYYHSVLFARLIIYGLLFKQKKNKNKRLE